MAEEIEFIADYLEHAKIGEEDVLIAKGNIEAYQGKESIKADKIIYYRKEKLIKATGNVVYIDKNNNKINADEIEIKDKFQEALIRHFTTALKEGSTIQGPFARKDPKTQEYIINNGFFTACKICKNKAPIWSIHSKEMIINREQENIEFKNLKFYFKNLPIFFFPYFSHTTNLKKRKSGFLKGSLGQNSNLGLYAKIRYYFDIAPEKDFTLTLLPTTQRGVLYDLEYRSLTDEGYFNFAPIFTLPQDRKSRNLYGDIRYDLRADSVFFNNQSGKLYFNLDYLSDNNLLRTFDYPNKDSTRSYLNYSLNEDNGYIRVSNIYFQNLRDGQTKDANPIVLPLVEEKKYYKLDNDFYYYRNSNLLFLSNTDQYSIGRVSLTNKLGYKTINTAGHDFDAYTLLRTDGYNYNELNVNPNPFNKQNVIRVIPEVGLGYGIPVYRNFNNNLLIIEPQLNAKISPETNYNKYIYNEDSQDFDLSYANLFANSHFPGIDIVEPGARLAYGAKGSYFLPGQQSLAVMLGQSFSSQEFSFTRNSLIQTGFSNYVSEVKYKISNIFNLTSKLRANKSFHLQTSEINMNYQQNGVALSMGYYTYQNSKLLTQIAPGRRREIELNGSWQTNSEWLLGVSSKYNISTDPNKNFKKGLTNLGGFVTYFYDCIGFTIVYNKDFTAIKNEKQAQSYGIKLNLKTLSGK